MPNRILRVNKSLPGFGGESVGPKPSNKSIIEADPTGEVRAGSEGIDESPSNAATGVLLS